MSRLFACFTLLCVGLPVVSSAPAEMQTKKVAILKTWSGSIEDEKAPKAEVIVSAKGLESLWKAWKVPAEMPKVDFTKNIIVAVYSSGSKLNIASAQLDENGNLEVVGVGTRDFGPGFRYVLGVVSWEGVKTVNRKELPKE